MPVTRDNPAVLIAEAKSLWNEHGYRLDTTTPAGRLAMLAPMLADALETALRPPQGKLDETLAIAKDQIKRYYAASQQVRTTMLVDMRCSLEHVVVALETALAEVERLKAIERARWEKVPEAMMSVEARTHTLEELC